MSHFSQKYYKHYIVKDDKYIEVSFWKRVSVLQGVVSILSLLLLLLLFLLFQCATTLEKKDLLKEGLSTKASYKEPIEKKELVKEQTFTLEEKIPKQILPHISKLVPKDEVTLEKYMFYVNDTNEGYPSYVDAKTNRIIKERRPSCATLECPVVNLTKENKEAYTNWLSEVTNKNYKIIETSKGFKVLVQ